MKEIITTGDAPRAIGPYSQAVRAGEFLFISGQLGINPQTGALKEGIEAQTMQALDNISLILRACGATFEHVVKTNILLADINDFSKVNDIYSNYFSKDFPARATYAVAGLPKGARIEIEAVAYLG